ncbi:DMT family transporter [Diplocloster modestus]|uniref:DMT family transporter n=1 Tax=Diplocloster modestus TaxID=2850322 RepID=A0ABS6K460_9FIRM|nr:DMT family transporter [Diplocloster modestus]MBU9725277.1 DMT family transporter [Diplocloster modestus]
MLSKKGEWLKKTPVLCFMAMICCALWGSAFPCIKIGYRLFEIPADAVNSQMLFAGMRFTLAGILVIVIGSLTGRKCMVPKKGTWKKILILSLFQTIIQYIFFYIGLANTTGVKASIIEAANVFFVILLASLVFRQEKLTVLKILGCVVGFAGVVLINLNQGGLDTGVKLTGEGFILLSAFSYAMSSVFLKQFGKDEDPMMLSGYQFVIGGAVITLCGLLTGAKITAFTAESTGMLFYLAIVSAGAYSIWGNLLKYNPASKVAVFGFMNPVFGVILSALLLHEQEQAFGWMGLTALVLVCAGIFVVNRDSR